MKDDLNLTCAQLGIQLCCYCMDSAFISPKKDCLITKLKLAIKYYGFKMFMVKCKPIIEFAGDDVLRYVTKCVEVYYPEDKEKMQSLLILL